MSASAGRILLIPKGDYSSAVTYNSLDWVRHNNAAWVCKADNTINIPPSTLASEWQLLAADSAMSDLGDLNDVVISSEAAGQFLGCAIDTSTTPPTITWENMTATGTYSSSDTSPISGAGVADALQGYYAKNELDVKSFSKYGGTKTGQELTASPNPLLADEYVGYYFRATDDFTTTSDYVQGAGHEISAGDHISVVEVTTGTYKFDDLGGYVDISGKADTSDLPEWIGPATAANDYTVVFDDLSNSYGYMLFAEDTDFYQVSRTKGIGTNSGIKLTYKVSGSNVVVGSVGTQFYLLAIK